MGLQRRAPPRSGLYGSGAEARWSPEGRLRAGEPAEQGEGVHVDRNRPIGVSLLEGDSYQAVGALLHSLLGNRRAQDISKQRLSTLGVKATRAGGRVQREAIE